MPADVSAAVVRRGLESRPVVLGSAAAAIAAVFALREVSSDSANGLALLYVLPVALLALELGLRAGLAAALGAGALVCVWNLTSDVGIGALGLATQTCVFLAVGGIAGRFSDRMRAAVRERATSAARLRAVLDVQERERSEVAHRLHEDVAQSLAAVKLGLDLLPAAPARDVAARAAGIGAQVDDALEVVRRQAVALRPAVLDGVGLAPALARLADGAVVDRVDVDPALASAALPRAVETAIYRVTEDALRAAPAAREASVRLGPAGRDVLIRVGPRDGADDPFLLDALRARLALLGGRLDTGSKRLEMCLPARPRS